MKTSRLTTASPVGKPLSRRQVTPIARAPGIGNLYPSELLYRGPWSQVYRVRCGASQAHEAGSYALKIRSDSPSDVCTAENMLRRETRLTREVRHANLVTVLSAQLKEGPCWTLMPYIEGATLRQALKAGYEIPVVHAIWVVRQMAQALAELHAAGWLHADVKPENVLVSESGHATLIDLGMARRPCNSQQARESQVFAGTLQYAAPEYFSSSGRVDFHSDLYSLGVVLYELLEGRPPFTQHHPDKLIAAHINEPPPALESHRYANSAVLNRLIASLLAKDSQRRLHSASELSHRLCRLEIAMLSDQNRLPQAG